MTKINGIWYHIIFLHLHFSTYIWNLETYNHGDHGWSISSSSFIRTHWVAPRYDLGKVDSGWGMMCGRLLYLRSPSCDFFKKHQETDAKAGLYKSKDIFIKKTWATKTWIQRVSNVLFTFTVPSSTKVPIRAARCKGVFPKKSWPLICVPIVNGWKVRGMMILLMEAILHHLGCIKTL